MSNDARQPLACVVGTLDLVRALGLVGINSAVVSPPGDFARYSRHTRATIDSVDASREPNVLVERLRRFGAEQASRPVLYYDGDFKLLALSRARDKLAEFRVVLPDAELTEDLIDKSRFAAVVDRLALPVPPAARLSPEGGVPDVDLRFPMVIKPLTRQNQAWEPLASGKAIEVRSQSELTALWPRLRDSGLEVLLQELIPGPETLVESYHAYVDESGETAAEFTGRKLRTYPARFGYSTALEITFEHDVVETGRDILDRLDFRGVAKLDFKRHPDDGRLYLLEVNPRFNIWHHPGAKAGVNIPEIVYRDLVGLPRRRKAKLRPGARWVHPWFDYRAARSQGISFARWFPWMLGCDAKYAFALSDPLPIPRAAAARFWRRRRRDKAGVPSEA
jgi:D-aspartate ligase